MQTPKSGTFWGPRKSPFSFLYAIPSAVRLMTLVPGAGHLVHMPGHIFLQTGDYRLAAETNVRAAAADREFVERTGATGIYPLMYSTHNVHFIAYARAHPGKINFGSSGVGASPHLSIELFKTLSKINIVHVPYKGAAEALSNAMSGHIEASVGNLAGGPLAAVKAGRVRALGVTSAKRNAQLPDVPTFAEQGVKDYDVTGWYGLCTQSKVPQAILAKINADVNKQLGTPTLKKRLEDQGITLSPTTPEAFAAHVKAETEKWTKVVKEANLPGD